MTAFLTPEIALGPIEAGACAQVVAAAGDIVLVVSRDGVIEDLASSPDAGPLAGFDRLRGQRWTDAVTVESRPKVDAMVQEALAQSSSRWRQINHPLANSPDVPVLYRAVRWGSSDRVVAIGRDLRPVASLQQRLVDAQQSIEREYQRLKEAETRYRLLFQLASEPVLIVDAGSGRVVEGNPAAASLFGDAAKRLSGRTFSDLFAETESGLIRAYFDRLRAYGRAESITVKSLHDGQRHTLSGSTFRHEGGWQILVRLAPFGAPVAPSAMNAPRSRMIDVIETAPDGFVVTDMDQQILMANRAFLDLAQIASEDQARGEPLDRWLGRTGVDVKVMIENLRGHGSVRLFATAIRGELGVLSEVEVSAVAVPGGVQPCLGFSIRQVGQRLSGDRAPRHDLPRSVQQMTELVGRVPLRDLVREATDVIERICIGAALELTGDNRVSAAELLGLSRQSLYAKLRRYGLGDSSATLRDDNLPDGGTSN